jgi:hypothetical protein
MVDYARRDKLEMGKVVPTGPGTRHERDQSFLVPTPVRKKISSRSRSLQKQILVPVPVKNILVTVPVQKKHFGPGPGGIGTTLPISTGNKKGWSRSGLG